MVIPIRLPLRRMNRTVTPNGNQIQCATLPTTAHPTRRDNEEEPAVSAGSSRVALSDRPYQAVVMSVRLGLVTAARAVVALIVVVVALIVVVVALVVAVLALIVAVLALVVT